VLVDALAEVGVVLVGEFVEVDDVVVVELVEVLKVLDVVVVVELVEVVVWHVELGYMSVT
jgi:hypothetical protein